MKKSILLLLVLVATACNQKKTETSTETNITEDPIEIVQPAQAEDNSLLIIPGTSIGKTLIGSPTETLSALGTPDFSDAAMGKAWSIWYNDKNAKEKQTRLMVYTTYKDQELKEKVVAEIRVNSGEFKTESGIAAGTSFETVQKEFPEMREFAKYRDQRLKKDVFIYDVKGSGIAFEFISYEGDFAKCVAIIVYDKSKTLNTDYLLFLPERELPGGE